MKKLPVFLKIFTIFALRTIILIMNVLLLLGLVLFACVVVWVYFLFTTEVAPKTKKTYEVVYDDVMGRCHSLYEQGRENYQY